MDPTVRKRSRDPHPMNSITTKTMRKNKILEEMTTPAQLTNTEILSTPRPADNNVEVETSSDQNENICPENELDIIIKCDLTVSDSDSEMEEGETKSDNSDNDVPKCNDLVNLDDNITDKLSTNDLNSGMKKSKSVIINTDANTVLEYVPESLSRRERKFPEYNPTRKTEEYKTPSVPTHQALYDLWKIVRNCDQFIGDHMERAMLQAGYLKPRN